VAAEAWQREEEGVNDARRPPVLPTKESRELIYRTHFFICHFFTAWEKKGREKSYEKKGSYT